MKEGITPEIDLSGALEDLGVSRRDAVLMRQPDGTWALVDQGSANGTYLNYAPDPVPANQPPTSPGRRPYPCRVRRRRSPWNGSTWWLAPLA